MFLSFRYFIPAIGLLTLLSGCVTDDSLLMLKGTDWILPNWGKGESVSEDSDITLHFDVDRIFGKAAVNSTAMNILYPYPKAHSGVS